jgi:hypothetical protein
MKLAVKKSYCPACRRLVRIREESATKGVETKIICTQCGREMYAWNVVRWKVGGPKISTKTAV